jgi:hypothetical protein
MATNARAEGVSGTPLSRGNVVAMQGAGHRDFSQRFDEDRHPIFREDPILDVNGTPITNSAGEAFDVIMPATRSVTFTGRSQDYNLLSTIALRAGRLIAALGSIPMMNRLEGWRFSTPSDLWWALLFEIAWEGLHPLLITEKKLWLPAENPTSFAPYNLRQLNILASSDFGRQMKVPKNWLRRLPDAWVSEINDVTVASLDLLDYILSEFSADNAIFSQSNEIGEQEHVIEAEDSTRMRIQRRFAVALTFPGERREFVQKVARFLRDALGTQRVFYDFDFQEELAGPNLDLKLNRIYSEDADLVVVFVCGDYQEKEWCGLEWRAVRSIMKSKSRPDDDIMFLRFDEKNLEGLLPIDGFMDISRRSPRKVADAILNRWSASR